MRRILSGLSVLGLLVVGVFATLPAEAAPPRSGDVLVFGDSITAQYTDDPGETMQGWWSILAEERNLTPHTSAQGGGAILKPGFGCYGSGIRDRFEEVVERVQPDEIWIASGRNETTVCIDGSGVPVNPGFRTRALAAFFQHAAEVADANGIPRSKVYVTVPWGTKAWADREQIVYDMRDGARAAGLKFINTPRLGDNLTRDGTHPNQQGSEYIADTLLAGMPDPEPVVSPTPESPPDPQPDEPAPNPFPSTGPEAGWPKMGDPPPAGFRANPAGAKVRMVFDAAAVRTNFSGFLVADPSGYLFEIRPAEGTMFQYIYPGDPVE